MHCISFIGVVEISPSEVAAVCQAEDQLELRCSSTGMFHRWEITVMMPQTMTTRINVLTSIGPSGIPSVAMISNSTFTTSRLSDPDSLPLISQMVITPVYNDLDGTVVDCFEGSLSTESAATTAIRIIDPRQFGKIM